MPKCRIELDTRRILKKGKYPIKIYVYHKSKSFYIPTGLEVAPDEWDFAACKFTDKVHNAKTRNVRLYDTLNKIDTFLFNAEISGAIRKISSSQLKEEILSLLGFDSASRRTLVSYLKKGAQGKSKRTQALFKWCADKSTEFDPDVSITDIDARWMSRFSAHLCRQQLAPNSVALLLSYVGRACSLACIDGTLQRNPTTGLKKPRQETSKRSLSVETMRELRDMPLDGAKAFARDMFFLSFYLIGINIADLYDLREITDGRIEYKRHKTGTLYSVKVPAEALEIIERHRGTGSLVHFPYAQAGSACTAITMALGRIRKGLSTYYARHTWATLAAELDIPIETISHALGHKIGSPVTAIYVAYNRQKVDEANRRVIDFLNADKCEQE